MTATEAERRVLGLAEGHTLSAADVEAVRAFHAAGFERLGRAAELGHAHRHREAAAARLAGQVAAGHRALNGQAPNGQAPAAAG